MQLPKAYNISDPSSLSAAQKYFLYNLTVDIYDLNAQIKSLISQLHSHQLAVIRCNLTQTKLKLNSPHDENQTGVENLKTLMICESDSFSDSMPYLNLPAYIHITDLVTSIEDSTHPSLEIVEQNERGVVVKGSDLVVDTDGSILLDLPIYKHLSRVLETLLNTVNDQILLYLPSDAISDIRLLNQIAKSKVPVLLDDDVSKLDKDNTAAGTVKNDGTVELYGISTISLGEKTTTTKNSTTTIPNKIYNKKLDAIVVNSLTPLKLLSEVFDSYASDFPLYIYTEGFRYLELIPKIRVYTHKDSITESEIARTIYSEGDLDHDSQVLIISDSPKSGGLDFSLRRLHDII